jgi:uncharacterized 2Fe-2S/4Fe-4S cluster protein (DUF4445 family)
MTEYRVQFDSAVAPVHVPTGTMISEAARLAGIDISQPCGGQGRCGRCAVRVMQGQVRRRSTLRLSSEDVAAGYALACQTVIESDVLIHVPPQERVERRLTTDRTAAEVPIPAGYDPEWAQTVRRVKVRLSPPSMDDQTDDWGRLQTAVRQQAGIETINISLMQLRRLSHLLRKGEWDATLILDSEAWDCPSCPVRMIDLKPGLVPDQSPLWGIAVDIGTTTVSLWLVDLITGRVHAQAAEYNSQIARGEDVISRIIYSGRADGGEELRNLVTGTINTLLQEVCQSVQIDSTEVVKATIVGNSTMIHLLLGIPAKNIRLTPFVTAVNHVPTLTGRDVGLNTHRDATVDCLPGVASYVGADITAGVLSSGLDNTERITIFIDVGTNGEIVLGNHEWLVAAAASAGPAFEGGGVQFGMRATKGAIEEVWINAASYDPSFRVIGGTKPRGICGSGLIALLAEMFLTGLVDKGGHINLTLPTPRVREGEHGPEYVVVWAADSAIERDIVITNVDIDNLLRTKAAIYAGFEVLAESVGLSLEVVEQVLVGGSFGKYINIEKAVQVGLLPDMPWDRFHYLGNTAVQGAYLALLDRQARERIKDIARRMTYIELSADNSFYEAFTSALFLPHTDLARFPTVQAAMNQIPEDA